MVQAFVYRVVWVLAARLRSRSAPAPQPLAMYTPVRRGRHRRHEPDGNAPHLSTRRARTALDVRASGSALVQYNSTTDRLDFNVRLRYAFREGTDLAHTVLLKYTHTLGF